jgi:hypothetical protein
LPTWIKVADLTQAIPAGLPYSTKTDEEGNEIQKTWQDLENTTMKLGQTNDGEYFIGTQALN